MGVRVRLLISGQVQGVFFRESTRREAERLGVSGWVRNVPDGRVEAVLDGPAHAVNELVHWCRQGPPAAKVDRVERFDEPGPEPGPPEAGFRILR